MKLSGADAATAFSVETATGALAEAANWFAGTKRALAEAANWFAGTKRALAEVSN